MVVVRLRGREASGPAGAGQSQGASAIDYEVLAGDEVGLRSGQEEHCLRDVPGGAEAVQPAGAAAESRLIDWHLVFAPHRSRGDTVHIDVVFAQLHGQGLGQGEDSAFGRGIIAE